MSIKVIGAGFGRTGTSSLKIALEQLGFSPCYHMDVVMENPSHTQIWCEAAANQAVNWNLFFQGYQATVDWPSTAFYQELMSIYPDAKVILTVREPEKWYTSVYNTLYQDQLHPEMWVEYGWPLEIDNMVKKLVWQGTFEGKFEDKSFAIDRFRQHNEEVKRVVPPEKLLVYEVKEGWQPLCQFLNVPLPPDKPFPHANSRAEYL